MLYTIRNEDLMAQVSSSGAQLMSLEGKNHTQYLWRGNPRYWSDRSLTIFPYVVILEPMNVDYIILLHLLLCRC